MTQRMVEGLLLREVVKRGLKAKGGNKLSMTFERTEKGKRLGMKEYDHGVGFISLGRCRASRPTSKSP